MQMLMQMTTEIFAEWLNRASHAENFIPNKHLAQVEQNTAKHMIMSLYGSLCHLANGGKIFVLIIQHLFITHYCGNQQI